MDRVGVRWQYSTTWQYEHNYHNKQQGWSGNAGSIVIANIS